jgi:hypothetical protein
MTYKVLWGFGKLLQGVGLVVVLVGLFWSISFGLEEEGLKSMVYEFRGLMIGGGLFTLGWLIERFSHPR